MLLMEEMGLWVRAREPDVSAKKIISLGVGACTAIYPHGNL